MTNYLKKIGSDLNLPLSAGDEIKLRDGASYSWFGEIEAVSISSSSTAGAGLKTRSLGMPLTQTVLTCNEDTQIFAKIGTKREIWSVDLSGDLPILFRGKYYLGHTGDVELQAKKVSFDHLMFFVEAKGSGMLYLALPKALTKIGLKGRKLSTNTNNIAVICGSPEVRKRTNKEEFKMLFKRGGLTQIDIGEIEGADEVYLSGGQVKKPFSFFSGEDEDDA